MGGPDRPDRDLRSTGSIGLPRARRHTDTELSRTHELRREKLPSASHARRSSEPRGPQARAGGRHDLPEKRLGRPDLPEKRLGRQPDGRPVRLPATDKRGWLAAFRVPQPMAAQLEVMADVWGSEVESRFRELSHYCGRGQIFAKDLPIMMEGFCPVFEPLMSFVWRDQSWEPTSRLNLGQVRFFLVAYAGFLMDAERGDPITWGRRTPAP